MRHRFASMDGLLACSHHTINLRLVPPVPCPPSPAARPLQPVHWLNAAAAASVRLRSDHLRKAPLRTIQGNGRDVRPPGETVLQRCKYWSSGCCQACRLMPAVRRAD